MELFVFDVDGTLVNGNKPLLSSEKEAMNKVLTRGDSIAIASGRPYNGVVKYLDELGPGRKFAITSNGAATYALGDLIYSQLLTLADYEYIYKKYRSHKCVIYCYLGNTVACHGMYPVVQDEVDYSNMTFLDLNQKKLDLHTPMHKIVIAALPMDSLEIEGTIDSKDKETYHVMRTSDYFIEFVKKGVDKSIGVEYIRKVFKLKPEQVHTFGDSMNDYLMIKNYDGTAMGNAMPEIKAVAKRITRSVMEDGVSYALNTWFIK